VRYAIHNIRQLQSRSPIFLAGFSLGGNVVLKLAGELGVSARELIAGVVAVSTPIDLAACVRQLDRRVNFIYSNRFLSRLKQRVRLKERLTPGLFPIEKLDRVKSVYQFDDQFTAFSFGFGTADNYYATQSSNQFLDSFRLTIRILRKRSHLLPDALESLPPAGLRKPPRHTEGPGPHRRRRPRSGEKEI